MTEIILESSGVTITTAMAKFGQRYYPIANIGSVSVEDDPSSALGWALALDIIGFIFVFTEVAGLGFLLVVFAALLYFIGRRRSGLKLMIRTSSGNEQAFTSVDKDLVIRIRDAIEQAVSVRK